MRACGQKAPSFELVDLEGRPCRVEPDGGAAPILLAFFETDCPTCQLTFPYLQRLAREIRSTRARVIGISQDGAGATRKFLERTGTTFPVVLDEGLAVSRRYDPEAVPTLFLLDGDMTIRRTQVGFSKEELNMIGAELCLAVGVDPPVIAPDADGAPARKPGCTSRHRESRAISGESELTTGVYVKRGPRATRIELPDRADPYDTCREQGFGDPLPVVPPTAERVERMLAATSLPPDEVVALVPPNYGMATVEKIAANAVMAGCEPAMMRALIPLVRAACDEAFNLHGVQATTHFAAPLVIVSGPLRAELGFWSRGNVFSNVARANSTLGRALQLILGNLGGARPAEIDMSTLGNPGKFSFCIAENEEESPWEPLHVERGLRPEQSAVTLLACEAPHGVSEHNARAAKQVLQAIGFALRTVWTYRSCMMAEALVALCPEHARTIAREGMSKADVKAWLFDNTGVPVKDFEGAEGCEGAQFAPMYGKITVNGEACYRKFREPDSIKIIVTGGAAGKFSAVLGSWLSGPRGSTMVTYPVP